jgi:hypothetical protein
VSADGALYFDETGEHSIEKCITNVSFDSDRECMHMFPRKRI